MSALIEIPCLSSPTLLYPHITLLHLYVLPLHPRDALHLNGKPPISPRRHLECTTESAHSPITPSANTTTGRPHASKISSHPQRKSTRCNTTGSPTYHPNERCRPPHAHHKNPHPNQTSSHQTRNPPPPHQPSSPKEATSASRARQSTQTVNGPKSTSATEASSSTSNPSNPTPQWPS